MIKKGDIIYHRVHQCKGTVHASPRAHSTGIQLILEGNRSPQYYKLSDISPCNADGTAPTVHDPKDDNGSPAPDPLGAAIAATRPKPAPTGGYNGDLTLAHLLGMQTDLRRRMEALDEQIMQVRVLDMIRTTFAAIRQPGEVQIRTELAGDALKIKQDTQRALEAAKRLAARGAL